MRTLARGSLGILLISAFAVSGSAVVAPSARAAIRPAFSSTPDAIPEIHKEAEQSSALQRQATQLIPLSEAQPLGHTLEPTTGPQPHNATGITPSLSDNWSGLIESGSGVTFNSVQADWVVPSVEATSSDEGSRTWIGIDGDGVSSLIQVGTAQNSGPDFGGTQYYAWIELLPGAPETIGNTFGSLPVQAGDVMAASIFRDSPSIWSIDLSDTTQSWSFSQQFSYRTPGITAEWIEEAPMVNGVVSTLADYGSTTFTRLAAGGSAVSLATLSPISMLSQSGAIISYPANFNALADSFSLFYGPPNPQNAPITPTGPVPPVTSPSMSSHGYWLVGSDGGVFAFGSAQFYGSLGSLHLQSPVTGVVATADRNGYWLGASDGGIFAFGDAGFHGSIPGLGFHPAGSGLPNSLNAPVVGMVPSADGGGYLLVASDGGVFAFGDARFVGSCPGIGGCSGAAVAIIPDASGNGYWVVTKTGHVYSFGDATYLGAPGPQGVPVTSAVRTPDGLGYWILFANGAIFSYGDAAYYASPLGLMGASDTATAIFTTSDGEGYWVAEANGSVATYGDAPNDGSMSGFRLNGSIIAATGW